MGVFLIQDWVNIFLSAKHILDRRTEITWVCNTEIDIYIFLFVDYMFIFLVKICFSYRPFHNSLIVPMELFHFLFWILVTPQTIGKSISVGHHSNQRFVYQLITLQNELSGGLPNYIFLLDIMVGCIFLSGELFLIYDQ